MKLFDTNGDGFIAGAELDKAPGLKGALKPKLDANGDGKLAADEISARLQKYLDSKVAVVTCRCSVTLDGMPIEGATIKLVPEPFLATLLPAVATTDKQGVGTAQAQGTDLPGVNPGIYRVEISKVIGGKETLPARYNAETTLGGEIASDLDSLSEGLGFSLKSN